MNFISTSFLRNIFILLSFVFISSSVAFAQGSESFDSPSWSSYRTGTVTFGSGTWDMKAVLRGTGAESRTGTAGCRLNDNTSNAYLSTPAISGGVGDFSFYYRELNSGGGTIEIEKSVNGGAFTAVTSTSFSGGTWQLFSYAVNESGSNVVIRIINDNNNGHLNIDDVAWTGYASASPTLGVTPSTLPFGNVTTNATSSESSFALTSSNLTGNVTITPPAGYEISTTSGSGYSSSAITLTPAQAATATIYVVFKPTSATSYPGVITVASAGATDETVTVSGTGVAACAAPSAQANTLTFPSIAAATIDGSFNAPAGGADNYLVVYSTSSSLSAAPATGVTYSAASSFGGGTVIDGASGTSFTATGLSPNTQYYFFVFAYNNTGCSGGPIYVTPTLTGTATTLNTPVTVATYTFTGASGNETTLPADVPQPTGVNAGVVSRGGVVSAVTASNTFGSANWQTSGGNLDASRYIEFSIAPTSGYVLTLTDISFNDRRSGSGPTGYTLRSSADGYSADLMSGSTNTNIATAAHSTTLSGFSNLASTTTFRLYAYGASSGGGTYRIDNLNILGFINAAGPTLVVSPTSLAFGTVNVSTTSAEQSFNLEGLNLTNNVSITAPSGYTISTTSGSGYTSTLNLTPAQAANVDIYVVLDPTAAIAYNGDITLTSSGATGQTVSLTGMGFVPPPTLNTSTAGPLNFGNIIVGNTSTQQSYTLTSASLTGNVLVDAPTDYNVSLSSGGPYTNTLNLTPAQAANATIYVVYQPTSSGTNNGSIEHTSAGATQVDIAVTGTGTVACVAPTNQATNLTFPSIVGTTINGSFTAAVGGADGYLVLRSTSNLLSTGPVDGVSYSINSTLGGGTVVSNTSATTFTTSANPTTQYYFFVYAFNNTSCVNGPAYEKPALVNSATTLASPIANLDDFTRADNDAVGNGWTEIESNSHIVRVENGQIYMWRDANIGGSNAREFLYQDVSPLYPTVYSDATSQLEWVFNIHATRNSPSGFGSGNYGSAFIIGSTDPNITTGSGNGYAVIHGNSGSPDPLQLVRFTNGLNDNSKVTNSIVSWNHGDDDGFFSVKVTYDPSTDTWEMFARNDGSSFSNPTTLTSGDSKGTGVDATYENDDLRYLGCNWTRASGGSSYDEWAQFDNIWRPTAQACNNNTWTGANSTDWFDAGNWSCNQVPTSTTTVIVPDVSGSSNNFPEISAPFGFTASAADVTINANASVTVLGVNSVDLDVYGDFTNNGAASMGIGKVNFKGATTQAINGTVSFTDLSIENAAGVTLGTGTKTIYGTLSLASGALTTNNRLTIGSDATRTGLIDEFTGGYTGTISGNITVQRYANNTASNFFYVGAPVSGASVTDWTGINLSTQNGATNGSQVIPTSTCSITELEAGSPYGSLFDYRENQVNTCNLDGWHVRTSGAIGSAQGFAAVVSPGTIIGLNGGFVTGNVTSVNLTYTANSAPSNSGFNLVTNPYAAPIEWNDVASANTGSINGTAYFYQTSGGLAGTYNAVNSISGGGEIGTSQSFIVEALSNNVTMSFNNGMKRNGTNNTLRTTPVYESKIVANISGNGFADKAIVAFGSNFTASFDAMYDARKLMSKVGQPSLYINNGGNHAIYAQPSVTQTQLVPLHLVAGANGNFTLEFDMSEFDPTAMVYLEDLKTGAMQNLWMNNQYDFAALAADDADRFVLHFAPALQISTVEQTCAGDDAAIALVQLGNTEWDYTLTNAQGTVIDANAQLNGTHVAGNLTNGTYQIELVHNSGHVVTRSITLNGQPAVSAEFNSLLTAGIGEIISFNNVSDGASSYTWDFGDGNTSTDVTPAHSFATSGTYNVVLTATNGTCSDSYSTTLKVGDLVSSINDAGKNDVKVFANNNIIYVNFLGDFTGLSNLNVYDLTGRKVLTVNKLTSKGTHNISLPNLVTGHYFVQLETSNGTTVSRVYLTGTE